MDLLRTGAEVAQFSGDAVVKARAHADDDVCVMHCEIGFDSAVHAQHAEESRIGGGECAKPQQGQGAGRTRAAHELRKELACARSRIIESYLSS